MAHVNLGIGNLISEWKQMLSFKGLRQDLIAGITVACIAIPLSLAIALASGVAPAVGLVTAIVAGIVCALFGGTSLAVSGPAAAMSILIADVVQKHGMNGLLWVGLGCGVLQLLSGVLRFGRLIRLIPTPVVAGFTAGIGAIILIGQLPRAFGLPAPDQSHVFDVISHLKEFFPKIQFSALVLAFGTLALTVLLPRYAPRLPASLVAVIFASSIAVFFDLNVETIGSIPDSLPSPKLPLPIWGDLNSAGILSLIGTIITVFALASLETLLSASVVDRLNRLAKRHDPNLELFGQGLGNIATSLFGGIPVTGVIARSALNIQAGAQTRRASIFHALVLLGAVYWFAPWISRIPISVLAGILFSVALRMLHPREFLLIWKASKAEAFTYMITFATIIFVDLIAGVQAGVIAALGIVAFRIAQTQSQFHVYELEGGPVRVSLAGPLTFLSSEKIEGIRTQLANRPLARGVILDLSDVNTVDVSGATQILDLLEGFISNEIKVAIEGLNQKCRTLLLSQNPSNKISNIILPHDVDAAVNLKGNRDDSANRLIYGVEKFKRGHGDRYGALFKSIAEHQKPHTLFIACSDSRINHNLITSTEPGELFTVRNVGNIIPPFEQDEVPAEGAAVEFAIGILGIREIVVCGHSECGAMKELHSGTILSSDQRFLYPSLAQWLGFVEHRIRGKLPHQSSLKQITEINAILQLENLKSYPIIKDKLRSGELQLHAWYYDIGAGKLEEWDESLNAFIEIGSKLRFVEERRS